jgi:hypothetical protein
LDNQRCTYSFCYLRDDQEEVEQDGEKEDEVLEEGEEEGEEEEEESDVVRELLSKHSAWLGL